MINDLTFKNSMGIYFPALAKTGLSEYNMGTFKEYCPGVENKMSFVGIGIFENGLLAFGDTKSSQYFPDMSSFGVNKSKPEVQKIFGNDNFLLATYGFNSFADTLSNWIELEVWINEKIKNTADPSELLLEFSRTLQQNPLNEHKTFHFIAGINDINGDYIQMYDVSSVGIMIHNQKLTYKGKPLFWMGGLEFYINRFKEIVFPTSIDDHTEDFIKDEITKLITLADDYQIYNAVGGPINTLVLK